MEKVKRFFECLLPVSVCNLECEYCYVIQENRRSMKLAELQYSPEHIAKALRKERLGGTCLISICGAGETLAQKEAVEIAALLIKEGHYVNITTNGTLSSQFDALINCCGDNIERLHVSFSMHYVELKKRGWIDRFFDNVCKMRNAGASILVQMNWCDAYAPYLEEIKEVTVDRVGAWPQIALTRDEMSKPFKIFTAGADEEYIDQGKQFHSPLFDFTVKNFNTKRTEFCYAGEWSAVLDLSTGIMKKCYFDYKGTNIFENIEEPICFSPVGTKCGSDYCVNSSHFMSLGVIPEIATPSYGGLRNRSEAQWQTKNMEYFLNTRLYESNMCYTSRQKRKLDGRTVSLQIRGWLSQFRFYQALHRLKQRMKNQ